MEARQRRILKYVTENGRCPFDDWFWELKIDFGPGFRVYFAEDGETIVVLLCGGDKASQSKDIEKAQEYWNDYLEE